ncbi:hypothetical protein JG688_00003004 [Phytophthora aleatoria]|uniref:Uncharacterized protein n=1 Tax=Phytophthora aleatoria TaxID=2496075 RepID=A0A8J5J521_9STRA|nr:hypothetical protein JG688_00003004 [Phytophthora aleatoria]
MTPSPVKKGQSCATLLFGWSYFSLMWNFMSRSDSIDTIMRHHIERGRWLPRCGGTRT